MTTNKNNTLSYAAPLAGGTGAHTGRCGDSLDTLCDGCIAEYCGWLDEQRHTEEARIIRAWQIARRAHAAGVSRLIRRRQLRAFLANSLRKAAA